MAFAEVEKFLDTPVKRYSSGMYVRLAFAVAAHLEPEILLVDEVLAVGRSRLPEEVPGQNGRRGPSEGRTVLFVSHNMAAIQQLCRTGILLEAGQIAFMGSAQQAIARYVESTSSLVRGTELRDRLDRRGNRSLRFTGVAVVDARNNPIDRVLSGEDIRLRFYYESAVETESATVNIAFNVYNPQGVLLTNLNSKDVDRMIMPVGRTGYFECAWPRFSLRSGVYTCSLFCEINGQIVDWLQSASRFMSKTATSSEPDRSSRAIRAMSWSATIGRRRSRPARSRTAKHATNRPCRDRAENGESLAQAPSRQTGGGAIDAQVGQPA